MLPLELIRADPERVKRSADLKGASAPVDELVAADAEWRRAQTEAEQSR
ncbi:MAG: serine--tRNA ligase, partial [Candidatus Dormibacteraeota bacterium]|nr:serine--tRNA ligase [Candidatus Dormibacteraeota bacterium]